MHLYFEVLGYLPISSIKLIPQILSTNTTINITQPDIIICRGNRMGWLCGECKEGYSVVLGNTDCYKCSNILHTVLALTFKY